VSEVCCAFHLPLRVFFNLGDFSNLQVRIDTRLEGHKKQKWRQNTSGRFLKDRQWVQGLFGCSTGKTD
ncbi:unnamed protein product, partial [Larinioides sclopetarius]